MNSIPLMSQCDVEERELVEEALAELTSFERSCLLLLIDSGFTQAEIAEILDRSQESVAIALNRAYSRFDQLRQARHGNEPVVVESQGNHPPEQQKEDKCVEACIKALPRPKQAIELPAYVRKLWETQDRIDSLQDTVAIAPPVPSALSVSVARPSEGYPSPEGYPSDGGMSVVQEQRSVSAGIDDEEDCLWRMDPYILKLVKCTVPKNYISPEVADLEIDDLVQQVRIKLWLAHNKQSITNPMAYIRRIVYNEWVCFLRKRQPERTIVGDEELWQGRLLVSLSEGMDDPEVEYEQQEAKDELLEKIVGAILDLPPRQRAAIICSLRERVDDPALLDRAFQRWGMDITIFRWPDDKVTRQRLQASCNFARFRLAQSLGIDLNCYMKRR